MTPPEEEEGFYILASQQGCVTVDVLGKVFPSQKH